ncbi:hypothetical protein HY991_01060 [Candidatus Micrarchaeota archaeon]|nr:hypothetical protein [Candidatus Micrarchaeota archaeon]
MGISLTKSVKKAYFKVEDGYYALMDGIEKKLKIPTIKYFVAPIEGKGIPSLPIACILVLVLLGLVYYAFTFVSNLPFALTTEFTVKVTSDNKTLEGASIGVFDSGKRIAFLSTDAEGTAKAVLPLKQLSFKVSKEGFEDATKKVDLSKEKELTVSLSKKGLPQLITLSIVVVDEKDNSPIENALVEYFIGSSAKTQKKTNAQGTVSLSAQQLARITVKASADGYETKTNTFLALQDSTKQVIKLKQSMQWDFCDLNPEDNRCQIDKKTYCELHPSECRPYCEKNPEECKETSYCARNPDDCTPPPGEDPSYCVEHPANCTPKPHPSGNALVYVNDEEGNPVPTGTARVYDNSTNLLLGESQLSDGFGNITSLPLGAFGYALVESEGFLQGVSEAKLIQEATRFLVTLEKKAPGNYRTSNITTLDEREQPIAATIWILRESNLDRIIFAKESTGSIEVELAVGRYVALAFAEGHASAKQSFEAGNPVTLVLPALTPENSAFLNATLKDEDGNKLVGASVGVFVEGFQVASPQTTDYDGKAGFRLQTGKTYSVKASYLGSKAEKQVVLSADFQLDIELEVNYGFLNISAFDYSTREPISAEFKAFRKRETYDEEYSSCTGTSCLLKAKAWEEMKITGKATGHSDYASTAYVMQGETKKVNAFFAPTGWTEGVSVELTQLTDEQGNTVQELSAGGVYKAYFNLIAPAEMEKTGVYLRIGSKPDVQNEPAGIIDYASEGVLEAKLSTTYQPGSICRDANNYYSPDGFYKWVELTFSGGVSKEVMFLIKVRETARDGEKVSLNYRGFAVKGSMVFRDPPDEVLGTAESNENKDGCYAETMKWEYTVKGGAIGPTPTPSPTGCGNGTCDRYESCSSCPEDCGECPPISNEFTPNATVRFNPTTGVIEVLDANGVSLDKILLQIDPVLPADAMPLNVDESACKLEYSFEGEDTKRLCYGLENNRIVFKANELNTQCPIRVVGNTLEGDSSVRIKFAAVCAATAGKPVNKTIPIIVNAKDKSFGVESLFARPSALSEGDKTAKLIFVLDEKQLGGRQLKAMVSPPKDISLTKPGAYAYAWIPKSSNYLGIQDGQELLYGWDYLYAKSFIQPPRFGLGHRVESCSDFLCCGDGFCTGSAFHGAFEALKARASEVASQTAFRRGNGEPLKYLSSNRPFEFYTIAQLVEGITPQNLGIITSFGSGCKQGNPGIYVVKASSSDGASWDYSAETASLESYSYIDCSGVGMPLCDFLSGTADPNNPIQDEDDASLPVVADQASDEHVKPKIICSYFFNPLPPLFALPAGVPGDCLAPPIPVKCLGFGIAFKGAMAATKSSFASLETVAGGELSTCTSCAIGACPPCCAGPTGQIPCSERGLVELKTTYATYTSCLGLPETLSYATCSSKFLAAIAATKTSCSSACPGTQTALNAFSSAFGLEKAAALNCENTKGHLMDLPLIIPTMRKAWTTCYPWPDGCHLKCEPKKGFVQIFPWMNQIYIGIHWGLACNCIPKPPSLESIVKGWALYEMYSKLGELGSQSMLLAGVTGLFKIDEKLDPASGIATALTLAVPTKAQADICLPRADEDHNKKPEPVTGSTTTTTTRTYNPNSV